MKVSQLKNIIKECLLESIAEIVPQLSSTKPSQDGIQKLQAAYKAYPSFVPDVITHMKDPNDPKLFVVVAKETDQHQYVRLSLGLPEEDAKKAAQEIKRSHEKYVEDGLRSGKWKGEPSILQSAQKALRSLKGGQPSGDTGMVYRGQKENLSEMHYFPDLNNQYYAGENLKIPKLSQKYTIFYRRSDGGFYMQGVVADADQFDHHAYKIKNRVNTFNQNILDNGVYTKPSLTDSDKREIEDWSKKKEVQQRREFEKKNFPMRRSDRSEWD